MLRQSFKGPQGLSSGDQSVSTDRATRPTRQEVIGKQTLNTLLLGGLPGAEPTADPVDNRCQPRPNLLLGHVLYALRQNQLGLLGMRKRLRPAWRSMRQATQRQPAEGFGALGGLGQCMGQKGVPHAAPPHTHNVHRKTILCALPSGGSYAKLYHLL